MPDLLPTTYQHLDRDQLANMSYAGEFQQAICVVASQDQNILVKHKTHGKDHAMLAVNVELDGLLGIKEQVVNDEYMRSMLGMRADELREVATVKFLEEYRFAPPKDPHLLLLPHSVELNVPASDINLGPDVKNKWFGADAVRRFLAEHGDSKMRYAADSHHALGLFLAQMTQIDPVKPTPN